MDERDADIEVAERAVPAESRRRKPRLRRPSMPRTARSPFRIVLDSLLIVVSVLLAFGLNEWRMHRADATLTRNVIDGLHREIESNLALLERMQPLHAGLAEALARVDPADVQGRPAFAIISEQRIDGGTLINPPAEAAWETALSTGALRLLDYETVAILSRIYLGQRDAVGRTSERIADLAFGGTMFDPEATTVAMHSTLALLNELSAQETHLMMEYRAGLRRLEEIR
jgi:hypothetical protein